MPNEYEKNTRALIQEALLDPLARIPLCLKSCYYEHQKSLNLKYLLQVNLIAQFAYVVYTLADILVLTDIRTQLIVSKLSFAIIITFITIWIYNHYQNLPLFDLLLPTSIIGASMIWFINLNISESPYTLIYQYASLVFVVLANLCVQVRFRPSLITTSLITAVIYVGVYFNTHGDAYQVLLFSLIYIPVLIFSVYISWNSTLKSRTVFLHHMLNDYNRKAFEKLAHTDALTGLNNRRYFESLAKQHVQEHFESPNPTTLLVFDVDHFKNINDSYGHDVGDRVLQMIADVSHKEMRHTDILARYGGEEFIALLTATNSDDAIKIAERLRARIANIVVKMNDGSDFGFTVSIGITILETFETDLNILIKQADIALYQAKANGRNRVEHYDPSMDQLAVNNMKRAWNIENKVKMILE